MATFGAAAADVTASSTTTFTNKTFDANGTGNSITNIENADIAAAAAIGRLKLADHLTGQVLEDTQKSQSGNGASDLITLSISMTDTRKYMILFNSTFSSDSTTRVIDVDLLVGGTLVRRLELSVENASTSGETKECSMMHIHTATSTASTAVLIQLRTDGVGVVYSNNATQQIDGRSLHVIELV